MAHVNYPHNPGQLHDCPSCDDYGRRLVARRAHVDPFDVDGVLGEYTIDGMDADEWIDAMHGEGR
jgi:hypothetical protein